jgi:hypothetical protein
MLDVLVDKDVDVVFRSMFECDDFFETLASKTESGVRNFRVSDWKAGSETTRKFEYQFSKTILWSQFEIDVVQVNHFLKLLTEKKCMCK